MTDILRVGFFVLMALACSAPGAADAHPMDMASIQVASKEDRLLFTFRVHARAVERIMAWRTGQPLAEAAEPFFKTTLGARAVELGGKACEWSRPELKPAPEADFVELSAVAICTNSPREPFFLRLDLPFLQSQPPAFQIVLRMDERPEATPLVLNSTRAQAEVGQAATHGFFGFVTMGMGHIGVLPGEWQTQDGHWRLPEGLDHIFFLLALIFASRGLAELLKSVTGFTLGHSLTLGLSAFRILHIHSAWVEVAIAFSIAYSAGLSLLKPQAGHRWLVAALFGTIHGLGFASALQELDLKGAEIWRALIGFNLGIELGQLVIAALVVPGLFWLGRRSMRALTRLEVPVRWGLTLTGGYWFLVRFFYAI